ncbi:MAG: phosphotransferase [Microthrixaceae bacterium]
MTDATDVDALHEAEPQGRLDEDLLRVLRGATDSPLLRFASPPVPLRGGFWAELVSFSLAGAPPGWDHPLVARLMPDAATAAKEMAVQAEVAASGFPTPQVRLSGGPDAGLGRAFMVMDLAAGAPLLSGLAGGSAIARLPSLARSLPATLADAMARLHALDAAPVRRRLEAHGSPALDVTTFLGALIDAAASAGRDDLAAAGRWLTDHPPAPAPEVVCHGDLHPFNVLVDDAGRATVLDWSASLLGPAAYDVAFTSLLLAEPPLALPRAARPPVRAVARALSRRFVRHYERVSGAPVDPASLRWHEGVVCLRSLVEVATWAAAGELDDRRGHPWLVSGASFARRLTALTGAPVRPV